MYITTFISVVMSLVPVSNVMELPGRCLIGLQNVLVCSLGAAVYEIESLFWFFRNDQFSFVLLFPPAACRYLTLVSDKSLFPFPHL